jgi:predicted Fe-Mo cluster-binding NifX family protein
MIGSRRHEGGLLVTNDSAWALRWVMLMRVALPIWEERISPVFDVASRILLVDVGRQTLGAREERPLTVTDPRARVETMIAWGVEVLICGAISRVIEQMLTVRDVRVLGRVCGNVDEVLEAYVAGELDAARFRLPGGQSPGGGGGGDRGRGGRRGGRRGHRWRAAHGDAEPDRVTCCDDIVIFEEHVATASRHNVLLPGEDDLTLSPAEETRAWVARVGDDVAGSIVVRQRGDIGRIGELSIDPRWVDGPVPESPQSLPGAGPAEADVRGARPASADDAVVSLSRFSGRSRAPPSCRRAGRGVLR